MCHSFGIAKFRSPKMETTEASVKKLLHTINISDNEKASQFISIIHANTDGVVRVRVLQVLINCCEYVFIPHHCIS